MKAKRLKRGRPSTPHGEFGKRLQAARAKLGLTQEQFAARVGVTWSTVSRWENGRGQPSPLAMGRIAELQRELDGR